MENWRASFSGLLLMFFIVIRCSSSRDIVGPGRVITEDGTLVSAGGIFELGFFCPGSDTSFWYLGIWYKNIPDPVVVWVANRETKIRDASLSLNFTSQGVLVLVNSNGLQWSSNTLRTARDPVVQLLDSGNLVVREKNNEDPGSYLWQGFDYPSDTMLPGLKIRKDFHTGFESFISAWTSTEDPASGAFSIHMDGRGYPQVVIKKDGVIKYRGGSWNGLTMTGTPSLLSNPSYTLKFVLNEKEVYIVYEVPNGSVTRETLVSSGMYQHNVWDDQLHDWRVIFTSTNDACENYALCGAYSSCTSPGSLVCSCLYGFVPKIPNEWNLGDWSGGCVRRTPLDCDPGNRFLNLSRVRLPDTSSSTWRNSSRSLKECEVSCLNSCNCTGYAYLDVRGTGCLFWHNELIDIRTLDKGGQDLFVRLAASELDELVKKRPFDKKKQVAIISGCIMFATAIFILAVLLRYLNMKRIRRAALTQIIGDTKDEAAVPIFDLNTIAHSTNNFSNNNKLGQGGFGPVYKGTLGNGQEIAVKRLSKSSGQGLAEFKTEVKLIAKLQHRNLVKLLGCSIHEDEKMLIYEYMANKSLDFYIFDKAKSKLLDWTKRRNIIGEIARGMLYLHQDSILKIIHRDLKASNILLDSNMIS